MVGSAPVGCFQPLPNVPHLLAHTLACVALSGDALLFAQEQASSHSLQKYVNAQIIPPSTVDAFLERSKFLLLIFFLGCHGEVS